MKEINISNKKELRNFGLILGIMLLIIGMRLFFKSRRIGLIFLILGITFSFAGLLAPLILTYIYRPWMKFAYILGWINTRVLFTLVYYLLVTPMGLIVRLMGKDLLGLKIDKKKNSYWIKREDRIIDLKQYEKQF